MWAEIRYSPSQDIAGPALTPFTAFKEHSYLTPSGLSTVSTFSAKHKGPGNQK